MAASRRHLVDGREVRIYDGLLSSQDILVLTTMFDDGAFTRSESARPGTEAVRHWVLNIPLDIGTKLPVHAPMMEAMRDISPSAAYRSYRCYCNHSSYGDMLFTHTDSQPGAREFTALWYIAPAWDVEWGGETVLFNKERDAEVAVTPKPGRLLIFDGSILHAGRPPNRTCFAPRYTLAYKLEPVV
jgi:hypothetical protein